MVIRGGGLGASMSRYLIERIEATPNIELTFNTEVVALAGVQNASLEHVVCRSRLSGEDTGMDIRNLFLFVGADPATNWLEGCGVMVDRGGFVVTERSASRRGAIRPPRWRPRCRACSRSAMSGRDRSSGSGGAIGEGRPGGGGAAWVPGRHGQAGAVVA